MSTTTAIEWTQSDDGTPGKTWNPTAGCVEVSPGCDNCYAKGIAERFRGTPAFPNGFDLTLHPGRLDYPIKLRKPSRIFVNSMSDLFHADVPDEFIADVFGVMAHAERHTFQLLTKRHGRMRSLLNSTAFRESVADRVIRDDRAARDRFIAQRWPLRNVWLGVSVEDQKWADTRIPALAGTPAAVRFISAEPLLGPVTITGYGHRIDWLIVGGESGRGARRMDPDWATDLRDQCARAGVAFFFKQAGKMLAKEWGCTDSKGHNPADWPEAFPREFPTGPRPPVTARDILGIAPDYTGDLSTAEYMDLVRGRDGAA